MPAAFRNRIKAHRRVRAEKQGKRFRRGDILLRAGFSVSRCLCGSKFCPMTLH
jgi:hypothetical protein